MLTLILGYKTDDLTDMGLNITECSPISTVGDTIPQTPVGYRTTTPVPTSTLRPSGGSRLHSSDPTFDKRHTQEGKLHNSFTGIINQVEVPFRNQGTSTTPVVTETTRDLPP